MSVCGASAGGSLALGVALLARDHDGPTLRRQIALYPVVASPRHHDFESYREHATGYPLTRSTMEYFVERYVADRVDHRNPYAFALEARDLAGLPPTVLCSAGYDPLRDEIAAYERRLADADVPVVHRRYESMTHDFLSMTDEVERAEEAIDEIAAEIRGEKERP